MECATVLSLHAENISKCYGARRVIDSLTLDVEAGAALCVFGPSGCGKTTLLRLLAGLDAPDDGTVLFGGGAVSTKKPYAPGRIGMVFQDLALWPQMNARQHLRFVLKPLRLQAKERDERIRESLNAVDLMDRADARPRELSGGERRRLALARATVVRPKLLLLDEPFSQLDSERIQQCIAVVRACMDEGAAVVFSTHQAAERDALASHTIVLGDSSGDIE